MQDESQIDAISLRKLRELKGLNRKDAGVLLETGYKTVEKFENGRTILTRSKIEQIIFAYGFFMKIFCSVVRGKVTSLNLSLVTKKSRLLSIKKGGAVTKKL